MILKSASFLMVLGIIIFILGPVFIPNTGSVANQIRIVDAFYQLPSNSVDILFLGASTFMRGISPLSLWEQYGLPGVVRSAPAQMPVVTYYIFKESLKSQSPDLVVLDAAGLFKQESEIEEKEEWLRVAVDPLRLSWTKLKLILDITSISSNQGFFSYLFPFFRYHSRWDELSMKDFQKIKFDITDAYFKGFQPIAEVNSQELSDGSDSIIPNRTRSQYADHYYGKIIKECKERGIDLILLAMPRANWTRDHHSLIEEFAISYSIPFLDYSIPENIAMLGLDAVTDFKDENHVNTFGAMKVTKALGEYLYQQYGLVDKRTEPGYSKWWDDLKIYKKWMGRNYPGVN